MKKRTFKKKSTRIKSLISRLHKAVDRDAKLLVVKKLTKQVEKAHKARKASGY